MINYFLEKDGDQVISVAKCHGEIDGLEQIDQDTYHKIEAMLSNQGARVFVEGDGFVPKARESRVRRHGLVFKPAKLGEFEIRTGGSLATLWQGERLWMSNSDEAIVELASQIKDAHGKVVVAGLGLGIVALLIARKSGVKSVTVYEKCPEVIELFRHQGFDESKIEIINKPIEEAIGFYDVGCFDHYNHGDDVVALHEAIKGLTCTQVNFYSHERVSESLRTSDQEVTGEDLQAIFNSIKDINDCRNMPPAFSKQGVTKSYGEAVAALIKEGFAPTNPNLITPAYAMYRVGDAGLWAVGLNWESASVTKSAKYLMSEEKITDYYEIYDKGSYQSAEIDPKTGRVISTYEDLGQIKRDAATGELQQTNCSDCHSNQELLSRLIDCGFYHLDRLNYYAQKPYGLVVEFDIVGLINK